jgi:hypothetical protein
MANVDKERALPPMVRSGSVSKNNGWRQFKRVNLGTGPYSELYFGKLGKDGIGTFNVKAKKAILTG